MTLYLDGHGAHYEVRALCMMFLRGEPIEAVDGPMPDSPPERYIHTGLTRTPGLLRLVARVRMDGQQREARETLLPGAVADERERIERAFGKMLYLLLAELTGLTPPWGILTGVRPVKLFLRVLEDDVGWEAVEEHFCQDLLVSRRKASLAFETALVQRELLAPDVSSWPARQRAAGRVALYVAIPFCPTRCRYCSFVSQTIERAGHLIAPYVGALLEELARLGELARRAGLTVDCVYFGGGTPTAIDARQLAALLAAVRERFPLADGAEFTVEAGRPDTIDEAKCEAMAAAGVTRVSVNPQSLCDEALRLAGRPHTAQDALDAAALVRRYGFPTVNMDLIAGLEGDTEETFAGSLRQLIALRAENITVHALSVKRSAGLSERRGEVLREGTSAAACVDAACATLRAAGYRPYYLYRQKNTVENLENTGWSLPGHENRYNIRIMDESRTILAAGAGAVTKLVRPLLDEPNPCEIRRIFHHKYPYEYISRFDEQLARMKEIERFYGI